jgi:hypothetical protein
MATVDVWGELVKRGETAGRRVKVWIVPKDILADGDEVVGRIPDRVDFGGTGIEDGHYLLNFTFDGKPFAEKRRIKNGQRLGGW